VSHLVALLKSKHNCSLGKACLQKAKEITLMQFYYAGILLKVTAVKFFYW